MAFKDVKYFYPCFNIGNKLSHYVSCTYTNNIFIHFKNIYLAKDINEFNLRKEELFLEYNDSPFIIDIINGELENFNSLLDYPLFIRKHVISFYFFREIIKHLSAISHLQNSFYKIEEYEEKLIPYIKTFELKMYCGKNEWNSIINYLYKEYKDLLLCAL